MSATHSSLGRKAEKWRSTRSAGHCSRGAERVVWGVLGPPDTPQPQAAHEALDRAAGHVPLPVALSGPRAGSA